ncbi:hypothetical protein DIM_25060 [Candidatus Denitrolinea symbiosum]|nr:hypothetical protein DIM_25060 [Candidatus Denitrolinea symbiosum]
MERREKREENREQKAEGRRRRTEGRGREAEERKAESSRDPRGRRGSRLNTGHCSLLTDH